MSAARSSFLPKTPSSAGSKSAGSSGRKSTPALPSAAPAYITCESKLESRAPLLILGSSAESAAKSVESFSIAQL